MVFTYNMRKNLNKGISTPVGILIIVLVAVILGGGILAWQYGWFREGKTPILTTDETNNWQIYRNEEYGFEIKYPPEWIIINEGEESNVKLEKFIVFADEEETETLIEQQAGEIRCAVGVYLYNNDKALSLYNWAIDKWGEPENQEGGKISEIKINDLEGIKYEFISMGVETNVLFSKNNIVIDVQTTFDDCGSLDIIFNQMLSSFKFID